MAKTSLLLLILPLLTAANEGGGEEGLESVLGCGGFIQSARAIDFSRINIRLLTKQGALKYETDCAPNNGYYFVPVYERGEYRLQVVPPLGWQFTPPEVVVTIDGSTDDCSLQKDINFVFAGFGVVGQVVVAQQGSEKQPGPSGVKIELLTAAGSGTAQGVLQATETDRDGRFVFTAVPGAEELVVRASHPTWQFEKAVGAVTMTGDNGQAEELAIQGFDVHGSVAAGGQPIAGVNIFIFGNPTLGSLPGCTDNTPSVGLVTPLGLSQLCRVASGAAGEFVFPVVPPGAYQLVPFYRGELTQFEVTPASMELNVGLDSVRLAQPFVVAGFSVQGRVLRGRGEKEVAALPGTAVTLDGKRRYEAKTAADGLYFIEKLEAGTYKLTATAEGIEYPTVRLHICSPNICQFEYVTVCFNQVSVAVSPTNPVLPTLSALRFQLSGQLDFSTVSHDPSRQVVLASAGRPDLIIPVEADGRFFAMLVPDPYTAAVRPSATDVKMGIAFAPLALDVVVSDAPVSGLYFSPVRVTVSGRVRCLGVECGTVTVGLRPESSHAEDETAVFVSQEVVSDSTSRGGSFTFENQLPGRYTLTVINSQLCWHQPAISFNIESESVDNLELVQTGWIMEVHSSHETQLRYYQEQGTAASRAGGVLDIPVGPSSHCLPAQATFSLEPIGCHQFHADAKSQRWSPGQQGVVLRGEKHTVSGRITAVEEISDLQVVVHTPSEVKTIALAQADTKVSKK